jgi:hypothetical protein
MEKNIYWNMRHMLLVWSLFQLIKGKFICRNLNVNENEGKICYTTLVRNSLH